MADELTEALKELREMFPGEMNIGIDRSGGDGYIAAHGRLHLRQERWSVHRRAIQVIGSGATLPEAMAQVRSWKAAQEKTEKGKGRWNIGITG